MSSTARAEAWDAVPCALVVLGRDGTVLDANGTFLDWVGRERSDVVDRLRLSQLLSVGGRIYWETHLSPLLLVEERVDEVALELAGPSGRLPVLLTARVVTTDGGATVQAVLVSARERSRYERELVAAKAAAEASAARIRMLLEVTSALSGAVGVENVVSALLSAATGPLGADTAAVWRADAGGTLVRVAAVGDATRPEARPTRARTALDRASVSRSGRVVVPLHGHDGLEGVLTLVPTAAPGAEPTDLATLTAVGQQAGLALERARLYEDRASIAHRLQQALLASEPPVDDRFTVTAAYQAGVDSLEVGGDWHDAFTAEDGVLTVVVGDVVGRGLQAAIAMGQLRSATRALSGPGVGPAAVLEGLDRFVRQVPAASSATTVCGQVELATGLLRFSCAGHLPPVLIPAQGEPRLLWEARSTPVGVVRPGTTRPHAELRLSPGDHLLLYTDGLVERRHRSLADQLAQLVRASGDLRLADPRDAVRALTDALLQGEQGRDDVCVVLLSWLGSRVPGSLPNRSVLVP